jgi:hypothetical protein
MKKIKFYLLILIAGVLALNACNEKEDVFLPASEYFVSVTRSTALVVQEGDILKLPVIIAAPKGPAVSVTYDFEVNTDTTQAVLGKDFWVVDAAGDSVGTYVLNFPEGTGTDTIRIYAPFTGNTDLKKSNLVLKSNSANYNLGMSPSYAKCVLSVAYPSLDDFVGTYLLGTNLNTGSGYVWKEIDVEISKGAGTDTLLISGFFSGFVPNTAGIYNTLKDAPIKVYVNINTMTFRIPPQSIGEYATSVGSDIVFGDWDATGKPALPLNGDIEYGDRYFLTMDYWMIQIFKNNVWTGYYTGAYGAYLEFYMK